MRYCDLELANETGVNAGHMSRNLTTLFYAGILNMDGKRGKKYYLINENCVEQLLNSVRALLIRE